MYLTRINPKTNLIDVSDTQDGVLCIKAFSEIIKDKNFGIECMTCIALAVDYASPMRMYPRLERPFAAMRFVTGNTKSFPWNNDLVMEACDVYERLQFNADLEELNIIKQMRLEKLAELRDAKDTLTRTNILAEIKKVKEMEKRYTDEDMARFIDESESKKNQYKLSRLEHKLKNKNTFYHVRKQQQREREQRELSSTAAAVSGKS